MKRYTFGARVLVSTGRVFTANFTSDSADRALSHARAYARRKTEDFNVVTVDYRVNGF